MRKNAALLVCAFLCAWFPIAQKQACTEKESASTNPTRTLGYEILTGHGGKLSLEDIENEAERIKHEIAQHGIVVLRMQKMSTAQLVNMTNFFGEAVVLPAAFEGKDVEPGLPEIQRITNFWHDGTWKGSNNSFGGYWHQDGEFHPEGRHRIYTFLYADEFNLPSGSGGNTLFADTRLESYEINEELLAKARSHSILAQITDIPDFRESLGPEEIANYPPVKQNLVQNHIDTGKPHFYYGCTDMRVIRSDDDEKLSGEDALALLQEIEDTITQNVYAHKWQEGDLIIWDNTAVLHKAQPYENDGSARRMLYRTQAFVTEPLLTMKEQDMEQYSMPSSQQHIEL